MKLFARSIVIVLLAIMTASCAALKRQDQLALSASAGEGRQVAILVATTREPDRLLATSFTSERSQQLRFARYVVSIPPTHVPSEIEMASIGPPDPGRASRSSKPHP